ncbi:uncharacterized protein PG998_014479 [Apiospora kogelbergensis]|uniref:uncharacterized protein n=1 Tax=Apiospora kogelbergensis TaxID=1337665 RepID=UPI0031308865
MIRPTPGRPSFWATPIRLFRQFGIGAMQELGGFSTRQIPVSILKLRPLIRSRAKLSLLPSPVPVRTVGEFFADSNLISINLQDAELIGVNVAILKNEVGLTDAGSIQVPKLFEQSSFLGTANASDALAVGGYFPYVVKHPSSS